MSRGWKQKKAQSAAGMAVRDFLTPLGLYSAAAGMAEPQSCHLAFPGVPAIHRGQQDATEAIWELVPAHGATKLFCRVHTPLSGSNLGWGSAHGELQELLKFHLFHKIQCLIHPPFKIHYHRRLIATMPGIIIN